MIREKEAVLKFLRAEVCKLNIKMRWLKEAIEHLESKEEK